jgi:hypothetical protein
VVLLSSPKFCASAFRVGIFAQESSSSSSRPLSCTLKSPIPDHVFIGWQIKYKVSHTFVPSVAKSFKDFEDDDGLLAVNLFLRDKVMLLSRSPVIHLKIEVCLDGLYFSWQLFPFHILFNVLHSMVQ